MMAKEKEKEKEQNEGDILEILWVVLGATTIISFFFSLGTMATFCWSMWFVSLPTLVVVWVSFRMSCPAFCCIMLCPDIPTDIVEGTFFMNKVLKFITGSFLLVTLVGVVNMAVSMTYRSSCGNNNCQGLEDKKCDKECGCSAKTVIAIGILYIVFNLVTAGCSFALQYLGQSLGGVRRRTKLDTLPESDSDEDEEENYVEEAPKPLAPKTQKMFSRLADALAAPGGDGEDGANSESTAPSQAGLAEIPATELNEIKTKDALQETVSDIPLDA
eukprot:m.11805 g.11805  ORF g.11805 m.11805 type:complete len:273 (+) comp4527_c0_seq1:143-961(+)